MCIDEIVDRKELPVSHTWGSLANGGSFLFHTFRISRAHILRRKRLNDQISQGQWFYDSAAGYQGGLKVSLEYIGTKQAMSVRLACLA